MTNDRSKSLGGTDVAAICGLNPYKTALDVYYEKKNGSSFGGNLTTEIGLALEPLVVEKFEKEFGCSVVRSMFIIHTNHEFLTGNLDGMYRAGKKNNGVLEIKTTRKDIDPEDLPNNWVAQANWYMGLINTFNLDKCEEATIAYIDGRMTDLKYGQLAFDAEFFAEMERRAVDFWTNHVLADLPPDPRTVDDWSYFPTKKGFAIEATDNILQKLSRLKDLKASMKELDKEKEHIEDELKMFAGQNELVTYSGKELYTWKEQHVSRLDQTALKQALPDICKEYTKESVSRVFRIK